MAEKIKWKVLSVVLPLGLCVIFVALLQAQVIQNLFHLKLIQLPLPSQVLLELLENVDKIASDAVITMRCVIPGMLIGAVLGIALAAFATVLPNVGYGSLTLMTALNSVPVLALAPLMNRWFSSDDVAKAAVVTIVCMGGMSVNAFKGFNTLPAFSLDMMKSYASTKGQIFMKLRFPNSISYLFVALKTNVATGMIAAIISEFYSKKTAGLGYMIKNSLKVGNHKVRGWAYILVTAVISIVIYGLICMLEKKAVKGGRTNKK